MAIEEEYIRLIFGLKLKQIRTEKSLSLFGLSKLSGLSKSYLNEIEKGKKYPKTDKIVILSEVLDVPYDQLVSLKLDKNLAPIGEILQSRILKEIPLDLFGIEERTLIDIVANAPAKVNAFISTIIEIAQHYNLSRESFYLASLRSYQEANGNYFESIEEAVVKCAKAYQIDLSQKITSKELEEILIEEFGYTINEEELEKHQELDNLRSVFVPKTKTLLLAKHVDEAQRTFIYAKELAYNFLEYEKRLFTFSWIKFQSFDEVLHNFYASYFAGALIIPRALLVEKMAAFFKNETFNTKHFLDIMQSFNASPESFYQRLTNILPKDFNLKNLFFLRFTHKKGTEKFHLKKELHITHSQAPHANEMNEHYCRRWISLKTLNAITKSKDTHTFDAQTSYYPEHKDEYLVLSSATSDPFKKNHFRSISIGFLKNVHFKRKVKFAEDTSISRQEVGVTCERCPISDCKERVADSIQISRKARHKQTEHVVNELMEKFS